MDLIVVSLFDGMGGALEALKNTPHRVIKYFYSEIDENAIKIQLSNNADVDRYPLGDITTINIEELNQEIDLVKQCYPQAKTLLIGGSPCQDLSSIGSEMGLQLDRYMLYLEEREKYIKTLKGASWLFWEYYRIWLNLKWDYFVLENVNMKKKSKDLISLHFEYKPILINSNLVTAQNRPRLYWSNLDIPQPIDKKILFKDILEKNEPFRPLGKWVFNKWGKVKKKDKLKSIKAYKANCLTTSRTHSLQYYLNEDGTMYRNLTRIEAERLQGVTEGYTNAVPLTSAFKALGNGFTIPVITHILNQIK